MMPAKWLMLVALYGVIWVNYDRLGRFVERVKLPTPSGLRSPRDGIAMPLATLKAEQARRDALPAVPTTRG